MRVIRSQPRPPSAGGADGVPGWLTERSPPRRVGTRGHPSVSVPRLRHRHRLLSLFPLQTRTGRRAQRRAAASPPADPCRGAAPCVHTLFQASLMSTGCRPSSAFKRASRGTAACGPRRRERPSNRPTRCDPSCPLRCLHLEFRLQGRRLAGRVSLLHVRQVGVQLRQVHLRFSKLVVLHQGLMDQDVLRLPIPGGKQVIS